MSGATNYLEFILFGDSMFGKRTVHKQYKRLVPKENPFINSGGKIVVYLDRVVHVMRAEMHFKILNLRFFVDKYNILRSKNYEV